MYSCTLSYILEFSKQFFIRNILEEGNIKNSILSYLSILSGPLLACLCGNFICLVSILNVLKEPSHLYEDVICRYIAGIPVSTGIIIIRTEYCSNFSFENKKSTYGLFDNDFFWSPHCFRDWILLFVDKLL